MRGEGVFKFRNFFDCRGNDSCEFGFGNRCLGKVYFGWRGVCGFGERFWEFRIFGYWKVIR